MYTLAQMSYHLDERMFSKIRIMLYNKSKWSTFILNGLFLYNTGTLYGGVN